MLGDWARGGWWGRSLVPAQPRLIGGNANPRGTRMASHPSPPSTPPLRSSSARSFGSSLRPQSPPLPSGTTSSGPRPRTVSHQSTPPSRSESLHRASSSGQVNASTASLPNQTQPDRARSKARDLLRKHYGLGVGPPPPSGKPQDPMNLGEFMDHTLG